GREADSADAGTGRLPRRAGRRPVQAGALPVLVKVVPAFRRTLSNERRKLHRRLALPMQRRAFLSHEELFVAATSPENSSMTCNIRRFACYVTSLLVLGLSCTAAAQDNAAADAWRRLQLTSDQLVALYLEAAAIHNGFAYTIEFARFQDCAQAQK